MMTKPPSLHESDRSQRLIVRIEAPARLHLGFVDVSGTLGRRFGSLGLTLDEFATVLELTKAPRIDVTGPQAQRAGAYLRRLLEDYDPPGSASLRMLRAIPEHAGLGSGTQLALAVGRGFSELFAIPLPTSTLATRLDRGARSGIGIGAFESGGFVLDGGRGAAGGCPPVIARLPFPASWRALLIFHRTERGLFGEAERAAFRALQDFPQHRAAHLAHLVLMRLMPALAEEDFAAFSETVGEIQGSVGDYFAQAQGGRYASATVAKVLGWLESRGIAGIGQTSWGPTGFAILDSEVRAHALLLDVRERFRGEADLELAIARGRNRGCSVDLRDASAATSETSPPPAMSDQPDVRADWSASQRLGNGGR